MKTRTVVRIISPSPDRIYAIRNEREYDEAVARLNALVDEIGDNPKDSRYREIETRSALI